MQELEEIKRLLIVDPVLALDLETKAPEGRPADEALETDKAQLYLVALAAGRGASLKSYALPPTEEVLEFVQGYLKQKYVRVVGHNLINYDIEVLHYNKVIRFEEIQARLVDTLPLVWMIDESKTTDRGLKASAKRFLGVSMTTFEEAFILSPNALEIQRLTHIKKSVAKTTETRLKILRQTRIAEKKRLLDEKKLLYEGKRDKESRAKKKKSSENIDRYIDMTFGEAVQDGIRISADDEVKKIDEKIVDLNKAWEADKVRYAVDDSRRSLQLYNCVRGILGKKNLLRWADIEIKNKIACTAMQLAGMRVDADRLESLDKELSPLIKELESKLYNMTKCDFNPRSSKQMNTLIFETLGVPPVRETIRQRNQQTGAMEVIVKEVKNTNEKTLARIDHPFVQALLNYRAISKLHSTYVVALRQRALADPEWRIHCIFNSTGTVTGRYSSRDPNLQNIPSRAKPSEYDERVQELGPRIRWAFCAPKGKKLVCADLSQIELRLIAQVTGDNHLLEIYNEHTVYDGLKFYTGDIHTATSEALGVTRKMAKPMNFGLCLRKGTKILTPSGYKNIEDIQVGNLVLTHKGRWKPVTDLQRPVTRELIRIKTSTGKVLESTPDHMHYRYFPKANGMRGGFGWVCSEDLRRDDYLCYHGHGYSEGAFESAEVCRLLGWYLSEGSWQNYRIKISQKPSKNPDVAKKMTKTLSPIGFQWYDLDGSSPHMSAPVNVWKPMLARFGVDVNEKSGDKKIPECVFSLDEKARLEILGALWDGDGCVSVSRGRGQIGYCSKSRNLLEGVIRLLDSVGINARAYYYPSQEVNGVRVIGSKSKQRFLDIVPTVKATRNTYRPKKQFDSEETITSTTQIHLKNDEVVYDITVEDDHSFVANGLITHNCYGMGAAKFARYARLFIPGTREWDVGTARTFKDKFMDRYQGIPETIGTLQRMIEGEGQRFKTRNFKMLTGRYRHFSKNENLYGGKAFNSIIQGSAADLIKIIVWNVYKTIVLDPTFEGTKLVLQVHDEVGLEVPEELAPAVGVLVKYIMERAWFNLDVPVLASVKVCDDWSQKDDDYVPEVGVYYARTKDGDKVTDKMYTEENWKEYADFEAAAKKDKTKSKSVLIKPAVAMLTPDEEAWAAQFLPAVECYSV